jgi:PAS domain S-box-containing protein
MGSTNNEYYFLADGGEMGELIRAKDWSKTPIGDPESWPQSLRTMVSVILNNPFGMYIAWGDDFTQIYNSNCSPIFGSIMHPHALGNSAKETFSEVWDIIKPMFDEVMKGNALRFPDYKITLNRNGFDEDFYFDFSYSPIKKENGEVGGILSTFIETTEKVKAAEALERSNARFKNNIMQTPVAMCFFTGKDHIVEIANQQMIQLWGKEDEDIINKPIFEILPEAKAQGLEDIINKVYATGEKFVATERPFQLSKNGKKETTYVNFIYEALKENNGSISGIIVIAIEVTSQVISRSKVEETDKRFRNTVKQAPVGITILRGPQYVVEMANEAYLKLVDREENNLIDRPLFDALPEVEETVSAHLNGVLKTGIPYHGYEVPTPLNRNGKLEIFYFDFLYHPLKEENGEISGILVTVTEVSEKVEARKKIELSEEKLNIIVEASELGTWELDVKAKDIQYSRRYFEIITGYKDDRHLTHQELLAHVHPDDLHIREKAFKDAIVTGYIHYESRIIWDDQSIHWVEAKGKVFYDSENQPDRLLGTARDITEEKNQQQALQESEKRFRNLVMQSPVPKAILRGIDMEIEMVNVALLKNIWRKNESDVQGKKIFEVFPELKKQKYATLLNKVFTTGDVHSEAESLLYVNSENGEEKFYIDFEYAPVRETDNTISGIKVTIIDVTEKVETRIKIEESEKKFRSLTESIPQLIWETDEKGNALFTSGKWFDFTGIQLSDETEWTAIIHPDDYDRNNIKWNQSLTTGTVYKSDVRVKGKDANYRWHAVIGEPVRDKENKILKWVIAFTDIQTEKTFTHELEKQVRERTKELSLINETLEKSEERYHLMVEEVQDYAILYLNNKGIVENWNLGAEKIKGYKAEEIIGQNFSRFYTESDREKNLPQKLLALAVEKGKAVQEGWRVRKNGSHFWASVVITAVHNKKNQVIGFSKVTHDLTDKKMAEDKLKLNALELEQKNEQLEKMNKELQSFAYISSHDLQEPLRKIQTFATQIMERESQNLSESGKDKFQRMQNAAKRMQTLINDLLSYSRTSSAERVFEKINLIEIIDEVKEDLKEEMEQKHAAVENGETCEVNIIPFQFRQLLYNLVSNSLKFAKPDTLPVIKIKSVIEKGETINNELIVSDKKYCHITISDNGIGFDQQYNKKIFEVFQRLHGREQYNGTGIGLAIVKKIVENHNGIITAKGEINNGATFDIYIPTE